MTQQRMLIHRIVAESCCHPTAEMIYEQAKAMLPTIALGTVYRNLNLMVKDGEIRRICIPGEPDRFDKTLSPHGHMLCVKCGKITDFPINALDKNIKECTGSQVLSCEVSALVLCSECLAKEEGWGSVS